MAAVGISRGALVAVAAVMAAAVLGTASAATYTVGEPGGLWDLSTNYTNWVSSKKFHPRDQIVFKYSTPHDVLEVNKAAYDSCTTSNAVAMHMTGNDTIDLTSTGTRYFICGIPGHCTGGMKIQIDVVPASSTPAPAGSPTANSPRPPPSSANSPTGNSPRPPPSSANSPTGNSPRPPPSSAASSVKATAGFGLAVLLAGLMA